MVTGYRGSGFQSSHSDVDPERVAPAAEDHAANRADVPVVTAPRQRDVRTGRQHVVRGVDIDPAGAGAVDGEPRMGRVGAHEPRLVGWRRLCRQPVRDC